jgi:hypothetical protein
MVKHINWLHRIIICNTYIDSRDDLCFYKFSDLKKLKLLLDFDHAICEEMSRKTFSSTKLNL